MSKTRPYREFLESKIKLAESTGFDVDAGEINPLLKDFVRGAVVPWAAAGGRRAIFSSFGLHKTSAQLELARLARKKTGAVPLIVVPLGVRHEFFEEAETRFKGEHALKLRFIRSTEEADENSINLTNYETAREGKIDPKAFGFVSLDEAACLRGFGGTKTFREFMRLFAGDGPNATGPGIKYRYVATATPDPNEYIELLAYAAFLGIMDVGQAKTRFFKRDSEKADKLTIHPHKEREFWLWVASWALFVRRPSDLGYSDEGYAMPALDVRWHEVPSDHAAAGAERDGQQRMFRNAAHGVSDAAREKRDSLPARVDKLMSIRADDPLAHRIIWHDLESEREAIERNIPDVRSIFGSQPLEQNEQNAIDFKHGRFQELATKPQMSGAGCNFQKHCAQAVFLGIGHKFHDFIQAVHRLQRFGQTKEVRLDLIYSEAERETRRSLEQKWQRHEAQAETMSGIIKEYGLAQAAIASHLSRSIGVTRQEVRGEGFTVVHNDCVEETRGMAESSVDLIVTSIPFSTQYEYTPSYNDFGHSESDAEFWAQMDFLTPELFRILQPGRVAAIHVKDRIVPGGLTGLSFQTVSPFHADAIMHYRKHGFAFLGMKTITTDVVRENNQTYRLGWSEQCKDGSRMGVGMPEYLLLFRKPPSDSSNGYADIPVVKKKKLSTKSGWQNPDGYSRARWQIDAHGYTRSSGDRPLRPEDLIGQPADLIYKLWKKFSIENTYSFERHVAIGEALEERGQLPPTFMLLPPHSFDESVWSDVARMRTLNGMQHAKGKEMHLCPLQFDIVERLIAQFSMEGETVFDPFGGLMTVPYCALKLRRKGVGVELNPAYFRDGVAYVEAMSREIATPSLFDLIAAEETEAA